MKYRRAFASEGYSTLNRNMPFSPHAKMKRSDPIGWESNPSGQPYGLPFFHGEKVSVTFGLLGSSYWYEHSSNRTRLIFTFNNSLGRLEATSPLAARDPLWYMGPHEFCIIPPQLETTLDWVRRAELVVLYVKEPIFGNPDPLPHDLLVDDFRPLARRDLCLSHLAQMFLSLCRQSARPEPDFVEGIGIALASRTVAQYFSPSEPSRKSRSGLPLDTVNQLTEYVDAHLGDPTLVKDMAGKAGLSPDHFARRFKITAEMSPKQHVLKRRVEKVGELLRTGRFNVTEAAREVGFHDLSHLNRCFRNYYGYSPKTVLNTGLPTDTYQ